MNLLASSHVSVKGRASLVVKRKEQLKALYKTVNAASGCSGGCRHADTCIVSGWVGAETEVPSTEDIELSTAFSLDLGRVRV